ncbi:MAG: serine hydrolase, partial [Ignavibacteriaceae bacterium]|nr:serine hydrolase [Ignavibacteriaceae bacterium]
MKIKQTTLIILLLLFAISNSFSQDVNESEKIKLLINKFNDTDSWINGEAINKLAEIGEPAIDELLISLQDKNENVRWCSAIALEKISPLGKQSIPFLIKALKYDNANVRWCSALALGKYKSDANLAIPDLQKLLYDEDYDVRWAAYISLSKIDKNSLNISYEISDVIKKLEYLTPQLMNELSVPGVSISIIQKNKIAFSKSFGVADANTEIQVDDKTMFEACSMSKPVFAYIVLQLVQEGKLDLDKPLYNYMPEKFVSEDEDYPKQITARMILTHTSGLPNWRKGGEERENPLPIYFKPGTKFHYSGEGFYYLQRVVERITNQTLQ